MANVLYLVHRIPYPPNKGDKVRSFHLLKYLGARHRVFLGTFVDESEDERHIATVAAMCAGSHVARLRPARARAASLAALGRREALTLRYYRDEGLRDWAARIRSQEQINAVLVFSSSMAQYADDLGDARLLVDFVDVDSAKWTQYGAMHHGPLAWLYRREGKLLLAYERSIAARAARSFFVTRNEAELFCRLAPECASSVEVLGNGVDSDFFASDRKRPSPFARSHEGKRQSDDIPLVFTGAMNYWPNIDGVTWFASNVLPPLRRRWPKMRLHVVGRSPTRAVRALASNEVAVTGTVSDVRPYLQHAAVVVAPLRLARGVQNKILEAMSMEAPVVASSACADGIDAEPGVDFLAAATAEDYVRHIDELLRDPARAQSIGRAGRACVVRNYAWTARLSPVDHWLGQSIEAETRA